MQSERLFFLSWIAIGALGAGSFAASCTDAGEDDAAPSTSSATTVTGASTTTHGATSSSGSGSSSSTGGGGGGAAPCLADGTTTADFTIKTNDLCAVAVYTAPDFEITPGGVVPTWGRHGGILTASVDPTADGSDVHIERWSASGSTLTKADTTIANVTEFPPTGYPGGAAVDLPFQDATLVSWTGSPFDTQGGVVFVDADSADGSHVATGVTGVAALGTATSARIVYTGLSAFDGPTNNTTALYFADFADGALGTSAAFDTFGEATGPVVADADGNVVAVNTKFSDGTQQIKGYAASAIAPGSQPAAGQPLLTTDGFGDALAVIAPTAAEPGLALYQPNSSVDYTEQDVLVARYTVAAGIVTDGGHETILQLATPGTNLTLTGDGSGHIWVGVPATGGGSTFYVLARP